MGHGNSAAQAVHPSARRLHERLVGALAASALVAVTLSAPVSAGETVRSGFLSGNIARMDWDANSPGAWIYEASGHNEQIVTKPNHVECHAGGDPAPTHYARVRRKLPEADGFAATEGWSLRATFRLPADFYQRNESHMRLLTTDNFPDEVEGQRVGARNDDEWRVGFAIYANDQLFRLVSRHQNSDEIVLWKASQRLEVGQWHSVAINFRPAQDNTGAWELHVDGSMVGSGSGVQTAPSTLEPTEVVVTRAGACIDGASKQDSESIRIDLREIEFLAER